MTIICACGCEKYLEKFDQYGRTRKYIHGHNSFGRKFPEETRLRMSIERKGSGNPMFGKHISESHKEIISNYFKHNNPMKRPEVRLKHSGENCHLWRGGITPLNFRIREIFKYRIWRIDIFKRDNYTCQICKTRGHGILHADHIKPFSVIMRQYKIKNEEDAIKCDELWDENNGRTLCVNCHRATPTYGARVSSVHIDCVPLL